MRSQTFELDLETNLRYRLRTLSHFGTLFYNAAMGQRREYPGTLNRTKQMPDIDLLCATAGIDPLPHSVMKQLLLELDIVTFTPARFAERDPSHFHALTWRGEDIEVDEGSILLQPSIRLPLPDFRDPSGILTRVRVRTIINNLTIVNFSWKVIPPFAGPGSDLKRAFGYTPTTGAVESYVLGALSAARLEDPVCTH